MRPLTKRQLIEKLSDYNDNDLIMVNWIDDDGFYNSKNFIYSVKKSSEDSANPILISGFGAVDYCKNEGIDQ